jgi:glycosyltransferase involved in cell wall biosynthesis
MRAMMFPISKISVVIPSYHEDGLLDQCLASIERAKKLCPCEVEIYVAKDIKGIGIARNCGARKTSSEILVFVDADCTVSSAFLKEVYEKAQVWENVGGGTKWVRFDRYSIGRLLSLIPLAFWLYWHQVTFGAFWIRRGAFEKLGGFIENNDVYLDYDFALRLKKLAKNRGRQFHSLKKSFIVWSTRGCEKYGQWFWLKNYRIFRES